MQTEKKRLSENDQSASPRHFLSSTVTRYLQEKNLSCVCCLYCAVKDILWYLYFRSMRHILWKTALRIGRTSLRIETTILRPRKTILRLRITILRLRITSLGLRITNLRLRITNLRLRITSLRLRITSLRIETTILRPRKTILRLRITSLRLRITNLRLRITSLRTEKAAPSSVFPSIGQLLWAGEFYRTAITGSRALSFSDRLHTATHTFGDFHKHKIGFV